MIFPLVILPIVLKVGYSRIPKITNMTNTKIEKNRLKIIRRLNCSKERAFLPFLSRFKLFFSSFLRSL